MDRFCAGSAFLKTKYCHFDQVSEELDPDPYIGIQLDPDPQKKIRIRNPAPHIIKRFHLINVLSHQMRSIYPKLGGNEDPHAHLL